MNRVQTVSLEKWKAVMIDAWMPSTAQMEIRWCCFVTQLEPRGHRAAAETLESLTGHSEIAIIPRVTRRDLRLWLQSRRNTAGRTGRVPLGSAGPVLFVLQASARLN